MGDYEREVGNMQERGGIKFKRIERYSEGEKKKKGPTP